MAPEDDSKDKEVEEVKQNWRIAWIVIMTLIAVDGFLNGFANTKRIAGDIAEFIVNTLLAIFG